jgi:hypothetical protein
MSRDAHVVGRVPDWSVKSQRFSPLVQHEARPRPMAVRRTLSVRQARILRARWLAIGCVAGWVPLALVWIGVRAFGGAP